MAQKPIMVELDPGNIERAMDQLVSVRNFLLRPMLLNGNYDEEGGRYALANLVGALHDIMHLNKSPIALEPVYYKEHQENEEERT